MCYWRGRRGMKTSRPYLSWLRLCISLLLLHIKVHTTFIVWCLALVMCNILRIKNLCKLREICNCHIIVWWVAMKLLLLFYIFPIFLLFQMQIQTFWVTTSTKFGMNTCDLVLLQAQKLELSSTLSSLTLQSTHPKWVKINNFKKRGPEPQEWSMDCISPLNYQIT